MYVYIVVECGDEPRILDVFKNEDDANAKAYGEHATKWRNVIKKEVK